MLKSVHITFKVGCMRFSIKNKGRFLISFVLVGFIANFFLFYTVLDKAKSEYDC